MAENDIQIANASDEFERKSLATACDDVGVGGMDNPMTAAGDTIYGGTSGTPTRLAKGTASQVLTMNTGATAPEWADVSGGGVVNLPLLNLTSSKTSSSGVWGICEKESFTFALSQVFVTRYKNLAGQLAVDNGANLSYWDTNAMKGIASIDKTDDYFYFTTTTVSEIKRMDITTKTVVTMTVSGATFGSYNSLGAYDGKLYVFDKGTTSVKRFTISGTTATYVDTINTSETISSSTSGLGHTVDSQGHLFYWTSTAGVWVEDNGSGVQQQKIINNSTSGEGTGNYPKTFFEWNGYVQITYKMYDSEDGVGNGLEIIKNNN